MILHLLAWDEPGTACGADGAMTVEHNEVTCAACHHERFLGRGGAMMTFTVKINTDNEAFDSETPAGVGRGSEIGMILRKLADRISNGVAPGNEIKLCDTNGNACGYARLSKR